jgi:hypothetical protein
MDISLVSKSLGMREWEERSSDDYFSPGGEMKKVKFWTQSSQSPVTGIKI